MAIKDLYGVGLLKVKLLLKLWKRPYVDAQKYRNAAASRSNAAHF